MSNYNTKAENQNALMSAALRTSNDHPYDAYKKTLNINELTEIKMNPVCFQRVHHAKFVTPIPGQTTHVPGLAQDNICWTITSVPPEMRSATTFKITLN
ncbi:MAG: hypothetical protein OEW58_12715 [Gammaproteobacteria bacterium]|nr:hypothetical protein [Gammaproteobacteria bacterium]